jgi:hypothetical protein
VRDSRDASLIGRSPPRSRPGADAGRRPDRSLAETGVHFLAANMGHEEKSRIGPILADDHVHG